MFLSSELNLIVAVGLTFPCRHCLLVAAAAAASRFGTVGNGRVLFDLIDRRVEEDEETR